MHKASLLGFFDHSSGMTPLEHSQQSAFAAAAHRNQSEIAKRETRKIQSSLAENSRETRMAHQAIVNQTESINRGLKAVQDTNTNGFYQISRGLDSLGQDIQWVGDRIVGGINVLQSEFQMGFASLGTQLELQRKEIAAGFSELQQLLENRRKVEANEYYLDGIQAFEKAGKHPEEAQFALDSIEYFKKSTAIFKDNPFAHLYLGHCYQMPIDAYDLGKSQDHFTMCATYAKGIDNHKLVGYAYFLAAWAAYLQKKFQKAIELGELSKDFDGEKLPENYYNLAKYYACFKDASQSIKYLDYSIKSIDFRYAQKASLDGDFRNIEMEINHYFLKIRDEAAATFDNHLISFGIQL